ncbi:MAG TPA: sigma-70 family RNA polymerase sigma factor [Steroidobacteraceae bacterium]|jgi:RNA polymerase sigma-70 factor (ECF subfamily)|nr:sigma-70 family RNA polymerase sigma factor [Steroidobacteraceae bacterium]
MGEVKRFPRAGKPDEFIERLCRAHEAQLLAYLTQMLGRPEVAREVAQDAFEQVHRMYRPEQVMFPRAMLFKVATNFALMHLRRRRLENATMTSADGMEEVPDQRLGPDRQAMAAQIGQHLTNVIKELRPNLRNVFVMAHVQGKPRKEIAAALGISEKRVDKRMTKALKVCRERLCSQGIGLAEVD